MGKSPIRVRMVSTGPAECQAPSPANDNGFRKANLVLRIPPAGSILLFSEVGMSEPLDITILGPGVVGRSLGRAAFRVGHRIAAIAGGRHPQRTSEFAAAVGDAPVLPSVQAAAAGRLVLLTVKDDAIESLCRQLASAGGLAHRPVVAHCSGALGSNILDSARTLGCPVGSIHPLQTFPDVEAAVARIPGTYFFLDGDSRAVTLLERLASSVGGHPVRIAPEAKVLYHAAAVMSANYLTTLLDAALELYETVGLDRAQARRAVAPLVQATIHNVLEKGTLSSLTGPVVRGDVLVIARHIEALKKAAPEIARLYCALGRRTAQMARDRQAIDEKTRQALLDQFDGREVSPRET